MPKVRKIVKTGSRFGRLVVVRYAGKEKSHRLWYCICDCGQESVVKEANLVRGITKSCGCLRKENTSARIKAFNTTHGESRSSLYITWSRAIQRCCNENAPNYHDYGGRGISMSDLWKHDYLTFATYVRENLGERPTEDHSLDRIDNDGDYEPGNLRWATRSEQASNRRSNRLITYDGKTQTLQQWADEYGVDRRTLSSRIYRSNWTIKSALEGVVIEYRSDEVQPRKK